MTLETLDGVGVLGYAGLGATSQGTQPSGWMSAVLRGRGGLTFEQALGVLANVANRELPKHLAGIPGGAHFIIVPAFIRNVGPRLYSIDNVVDRKAGLRWYRYTRHQVTAESTFPGSRGPRTALGGSGGIYLAHERAAWLRSLLRLVNANDHGKVSDLAVADYLAWLNHKAHQEVTDGTVGPRCVVVWRRRPGIKREVSGGAFQFYTGTERDPDSSPIPSIANGMDVQSLASFVMRDLFDRIAIHGFGPEAFQIDGNEMNAKLAKLPSEPDERLR